MRGTGVGLRYSPSKFPGVSLFLLGLMGLVGGCQRAEQPAVKAEIQVEIEPSPPKVGQADLAIKLTDGAGQPLSVGALEVEGNMNHAGMKPVFTTLREAKPGQYVGTIEFTMGGDWFLLLTGQLADGRQIDEKVDVPGVQRP